ncbi:MAG: hypothetical protein JWQ76_3682 [Ramlibacter sp.]|nr:hypothetical protein [Ramlibacter sp.]
MPFRFVGRVREATPPIAAAGMLGSADAEPNLQEQT